MMHRVSCRQVFQGLLRSSVGSQKNIESMLRLWCNEVFRVFNDKLIDEKYVKRLKKKMYMRVFREKKRS
jgi:hypothetical protein